MSVVELTYFILTTQTYTSKEYFCEPAVVSPQTTSLEELLTKEISRVFKALLIMNVPLLKTDSVQLLQIASKIQYMIKSIIFVCIHIQTQNLVVNRPSELAAEDEGIDVTWSKVSFYSKKFTE